ncbi:DNA (cytosine-5-)-methyltransferase [Myroides odoratimimus CCUG 12901]|uniref:DNA cytosine methyltransferase n=1 Tax=Myroides TaxID=76831 RepID=UPI0002460D49|nr:MULTISPECIES: DNA cytosine methyltransferase [Myroides]EHO13115.1 DNA (cytosine-5-)-methyltransferase [Myroides odoratimimus CCUG 12901]MDX4974120.1 DNA cytosine methyltransferase [Myroides odoratimimus]
MTIIDFFCGAGGFSEGFRQMGFNIVQGYDHWKPAVDTFNHNFNLQCEVKNILDFENSIEEIENIPNTSVILGSPPCVSFSSSNKSGKADKKLGLRLIKTFLRIVAVKKHQENSILEGWFMENVVNSKKHLQEVYTFAELNLAEWALKNGKTPDCVALRLLSNTFIINSADYGSHQSRKRSISGEIISKEAFIVPTPTHEEKGTILKPWRTLGQLINNLPTPSLKTQQDNITDPIYPEIKIKAIELTDHFYDSGLYECEWRQSKELKINHHCMGKMSFPENANKPSRTVTATKSGTSREGLVYKSDYNRTGDGEYRSPTIREIASIMGFPITYQFTGNLYAKWRQVGNAVCPSVSRALAKEFLIQNNYNIPLEITLQKKVNLEGIVNLNDFSEAIFSNPPKRTKNSKYRRHPIKDGNLTVTLSNFNILSNEKAEGKWFTSVQYGTGANFKHQEISDGFYLNLENIIKNEVKGGERFIKIINNGFSEKIANSSQMQKMYEQQKCENGKREPTHLMDDLKKIIDDIELDKEIYSQNQSNVIFKFKDNIPVKQILALYGVNKITTLANEHTFN